MVSELEMANAIRVLSMDAINKANSGHPGAPMGLADVASVLFNRFINIDPKDDQWPDRDRFVLSAGHGSMLHYSMNYLLGYDDMPMSEIENFRQLGSVTAGHPEYGHAKGIEITTGPLGTGLCSSVGMALGERMMNARFGDELVDHYTYVLAGDGCLMEGVSHEAIDLAGTLGLGKLIVFWDDNNITIDGEVSLSSNTNQQARFEAAGWHVQSIDGHDNEAIAKAIIAARDDNRPSMIACKTIIGKGAPNKAGSHKVHGAPLGQEETALAKAAMGWHEAPFTVPSDIKAAWEAVGKRGEETRKSWEGRLASSPKMAEFNKQLKGIDGAALNEALVNFTKTHADEKTKVATRKASEMTLEVINGVTDVTIGGSADLTGSNLTKTSQTQPINAQDFSGRYVYYGIREFGMGLVMNGLYLHGGFRPYGGTFLVFADFMRGAIRLAALMGLPIPYVLTHDSIGLGEDGPTHQPVETLASLRAIPNLDVFRPCDIIETAEAWELALTSEKTPTVLALSRQNLPCLRSSGENMSAKGAYLIRDIENRDLTIIASGSEVEIALKAAEELEKQSIKAAVVSAPSFERFAQQTAAYRSETLGDKPRIGVEAAIRQSWDGLMLRNEDKFIGMTGFGASAPAGDLYEEFGITVSSIIAAAQT